MAKKLWSMKLIGYKTCEKQKDIYELDFLNMKYTLVHNFVRFNRAKLNGFELILPVLSLINCVKLREDS